MVAVKPADINAVLSRAPEVAVTLVYGPDAGLVSERVSKLAALVVGNDSDPFRLIRLDGDVVAADPMRLTDEANTISLFGGKRAIVIRAGSKSIATGLKYIIDAPPVDAVVIIQAGDLARTSPLRMLCERSRQALAIPCYADGPRELGALIDGIMTDHCLTLDADARVRLLSLLGADRLTSRNEVEKLALYARDTTNVTIEDVDAVCGDAGALATDSVVDATFIGDIQRLDLESRRLFADGTDAGVLAGSLLRHGLTLMSARSHIVNGAPAAQAIEKMRLHFKRKDSVNHQLRIWKIENLVQVTTDLASAIARCRQNTQICDEIARVAMWSVAMRASRLSTRR